MQHLRLRCLLVDIRGRIEGEIGAFPYQRPLKNMDLVSSVDQGTFLAGAQVANPCDFRCSDQMYCNPGVQGAISGQVMGRAACDIANIQCMGSAKSGATNLPVCGGMDTMASWQFAEHRKELKVCYFPSISFLFTRS
jgi:hypothetical protein